MNRIYILFFTYTLFLNNFSSSLLLKKNQQKSWGQAYKESSINNQNSEKELMQKYYDTLDITYKEKIKKTKNWSFKGFLPPRISITINKNILQQSIEEYTLESSKNTPSSYALKSHNHFFILRKTLELFYKKFIQNNKETLISADWFSVFNNINNSSNEFNINNIFIAAAINKGVKDAETTMKKNFNIDMVNTFTNSNIFNTIIESLLNSIKTNNTDNEETDNYEKKNTCDNLDNNNYIKCKLNTFDKSFIKKINKINDMLIQKKFDDFAIAEITSNAMIKGCHDTSIIKISNEETDYILQEAQGLYQKIKKPAKKIIKNVKQKILGNKKTPYTEKQKKNIIQKIKENRQGIREKHHTFVNNKNIDPLKHKIIDSLIEEDKFHKFIPGANNNLTKKKNNPFIDSTYTTTELYNEQTKNEKRKHRALLSSYGLDETRK
jgi:hypothetical protein